MITINEFTLGIAIMLLTGLLFGKIVKLFKIPNITGYIIGGLIIGPALAHLIFPATFAISGGMLGEEFVSALGIIADIELGFIAFSVGSEFKINYFKQVGAAPVIMAFAESLGAVVFIVGGVTLVGLFFGMPLYFALCLGAVGGATAPAATILVVRQYRAKGPLTQNLLSVVAIDDASALIYFGVLMAIVKTIIRPGSNVLESILMPFAEILGSLALGVAVGFLLVLFIKPFSSKGNRLILVIAMIFVNIGVCKLLNTPHVLFKEGMALSSVLACMATGAVFANFTNLTEDIMPLIEGITPPLVVLFFIHSGADLKLDVLGKVGIVGIVLVLTYLVFRVAGKMFGTWASAKACKSPTIVKKWLGFGLLPQGGIAIGLSVIVMNTLKDAPGVVGNFNGDRLRVIVLCAVFISEVFGPILCKYALLKSGEGQAGGNKKPVTAAAAAADSPPTSTDPPQSSNDN